MTARDNSPQTGSDLRVDPDANVRVVDNVLDPSTCAALIGRLDDQGWLTRTADLRRPANGPHVPVPRRREEPNTPVRLLATDEPPRFAVIEDPVLALRLFHRIGEVLPLRLDQAELAGLKPLLRCVRLREGEGTHAHEDPARECAGAMHSELSVVVFLNDDFAGGGIEFPTLGKIVEAKTGRALVFDHRLLHRDLVVSGNDGFTLQAEVFYSDAWQPMR